MTEPHPAAAASTDAAAVASTPPPSDAPANDPSDPLRLLDAAHRLFDDGSGALRAARGSADALRSLIRAELALALTAIARGLAWGLAAALAALSVLGYLAATVSAALVGFGLSWTAALATSAGLLVLVLALLVWRALAMFRLARFERSRRQWARLREGIA